MQDRSSQSVVMWRRTVPPALWALRTYWGTAVLLAATAATALTALLPVTALTAPSEHGLATRLRLVAWRGGDLGMSWSTIAWSPTATQHAALVTLFQLLLGVTAGVLGVATLTIVCVSAARASDRALKVSVRRAVGASRRDLLAAALIEASAIAAGGLIVGGACGLVAGRLVVAGWPYAVGPATDAGNLVAVLATLAGIVLGALAAVVFPRRTSPLPGAGGKPLELFVPALQLGLSLTILTAAALVQREAGRLLVAGHAPSAPGEVFELTVPESSPATRAQDYTSLLHRLETGPGFDTVSLTSAGTLAGLGMVDVVTTDCGRCYQGGLALPLHPVLATHYLVSADTFRVLGLPVPAGRGITSRDRWSAPRVAVVNHSLAARHFGLGKAVGRGILIGRQWYKVVGVVQDQRPIGFEAGLQPPYAVYLSVFQQPAPSVDLFARGPTESRITAVVERQLRATMSGGTQVVHESVSRLLAAQAAPYQWFGRMFGAEGWVTLAVATLGTVAVMRLWIASLFYEFGVRRAVGARRRDLLRFVLSRVVGVAIGGVAIGLWAGLILWGTLATAVAGLPAWDLGTALRFAPLLLGATLAGAVPLTWRAARAAPRRLLETASG